MSLKSIHSELTPSEGWFVLDMEKLRDFTPPKLSELNVDL